MATSCSSSYTVNHTTMKVLVILCIVSLSFAAEEDGRYVPDNSGQYIPTDEGQYIPDDSGKYIHDGTGGYKNDGTGKYSGQFNGINSNLLSSSSRQRPVIQPVVEIRSTTLRPSTYTPPTTRQPQKTYNNLQEGQWKIIRQLGDIDVDGGYHWEYETENKITAEESGKLHNVGTDAETMRAKGFYQYTGPDNVVYTVQYTADENGFFPVGNHLPTPPPIPAEILKALEADRAQNKI